MPFIPLIAAAAALATAGYALYLWYRQKQLKPENGDDGSRPMPRPGDGDDQAASSGEIRKEEAVARIARQAPELGPVLARAADLPNADHVDVRIDPDDESVVRRVAQNLDGQILECLLVAAEQRAIQFDLQSRVERQLMMFPARYVEVVSSDDPAFLPDIVQEQQVLDDDMFYLMLVTGGLLHCEYYDDVRIRKRLHILLDVSESMKELMRSGLSRHTWSRGVAISLLIMAIRGEAEFMLRPFSGAPGGLMQASASYETARLIDNLLRMGLSPTGTDISMAVHQAVRDIRAQSRSSEISGGDILLITDAEDHRADPEQLAAVLGPDIRLHLAAIGTDGGQIRKCATSVKVFQ